MKNKAVHILCTRSIDQSLIEKAAERNIIIDVIPFIQTELIHSDETKKVIAETGENEVVIFSSVNAVDAVSAQLNGKNPLWIIYCVGRQTAKAAAEKFPGSRLAAHADYAAQLAPIISSDKSVQSVTFFCGNLRRPDLPQLLHQQQISLKEVTVYNTELTPHTCTRNYDGVVFFSPSAADSFFSVNSISPATALFSIGSTTARSIEQYVPNKVITTDHPGKQQLIELVIRHFHHINNS
jgi:uroporphyrinogen-III synthase